MAAANSRVPPIPLLPVLLSIVITGITLAVGQWLMRRTQHRMASRVKWT
jgi:hypothetical protein